MIARFWCWLFDLRSPRASVLAGGASSAETAARVLQAQAQDSYSYALTLPVGPQRDLAKMQGHFYSARAAMYRAEDHGLEDGVKFHKADAEYWARHIDLHTRAAPVVDLNTVRQMREAGL